MGATRLKDGDFKGRVVEPLRYLHGGTDHDRVYWAYRDFMLICALTKELEATLGPRSLADVLEQDGQDEASRWHHVEERFFVLLKAAYLFGNILCSVLLTDALAEDREVSTVAFLTKDRRSQDIDTSAAVPAYCLVKYRHMLINHHDVRRMSARLRTADGKRRLVPFPEQMQGIEADGESLMTLRDRYAGLIAKPDETNLYNLVTQLFQVVPCRVGDAANKDRDTIDRIAKKGGCESMTIDELVLAVDHFAVAVAEGASRWRRSSETSSAA